MEDFANKNEINWSDLGFSKEEKMDILSGANSNAANSSNFNLDLKDIMGVGSDVLLDINDFMGVELKDVDTMLEFDFTKELEEIEIDGGKCNFELNQDYINSIFNDNNGEFDLKDSLLAELKPTPFTSNKTSEELNTHGLSFAASTGNIKELDSISNPPHANNSVIPFDTQTEGGSPNFLFNLKDASSYTTTASPSQQQNFRNSPHLSLGKSLFSSDKKVSESLNTDTKPGMLELSKDINAASAEQSPSNARKNTHLDFLKSTHAPGSGASSGLQLSSLSSDPPSTKTTSTKFAQSKPSKPKRKASLISGKKSQPNKLTNKRNSSKKEASQFKEELITLELEKNVKPDSTNDMSSFYKSLKSPVPENNIDAGEKSRSLSESPNTQQSTKKNSRKLKSSASRKSSVDDATTPIKTLEIQNSETKPTLLKKRRSSKVKTKVSENGAAHSLIIDEGYYSSPTKYLKLFGNAFSAEPQSILSEKNMYLSLTNGIVPVPVSCSCKNIIAISWPSTFKNSIKASSEFINIFKTEGASPANIVKYPPYDHKNEPDPSLINSKAFVNSNFQSDSSKEYNQTSGTCKSSVVNIFKLTNIRPKTDDYGKEFSATQRLIPLGQVYIDPKNFSIPESQSTIADSKAVPNTDLHYNSPAQVWWCNEGEHLALSDSAGRLSVFQIKDSPSKWQVVFNKHLVYPISSFLWVSDCRKHISTVSYLPEVADNKPTQNISDSDISICLSKKLSSVPSFGKVKKIFFALSRVGRLHMMSHQDQSDNDVYIDISPPNNATKLSGSWAISHSDIAQISSNYFENKYHFEILGKVETDKTPHSTIYLLVVVHWIYFNATKPRSEISDSYIRKYIVCAKYSSAPSMYLVASGELKMDNSVYKTTLLKLAPPTHFNSSQVDLPRLHRIIIGQSKIAASTSENQENPQLFESMLYGFDIVFEKNPIAEGTRLHKLRSLRVMHYKNPPNNETESNFGLPIGINILNEMFAINYNSMSPLGIKPPKGETHCAWVVYWSNGSLTSYVKAMDKKAQPYESKIIVPLNKAQNLFSKCWTTCGALISDSTRFLRVNSSIVEDKINFCDTNCGNLELIDIEVLKNSYTIAGTQLYMPSISKNKAILNKGNLELSYEYIIASILASRILNESDASDIIDALVKLFYKANIEVDIKSILSITGSILCEALGVQTITLSLIDSNSWFFVVFFGISMKVLSLTHKDSLLSSTISFLLHVSSISNAYSSVRASTLTGISGPAFNPKILGYNANIPKRLAQSDYLLNYPPFFGPDISSSIPNMNNGHPFYPLLFEEWSLYYSQMLSQATWAMNAISFLVRELYLWFHSYNQQLSNPNVNPVAGYSANFSKKMWQTIPSRVVLLAHLQTVTSICDCFKLLWLLKSDINMRIQVLSQLQSSNRDSWTLPQSLNSISDLSTRLNQTINSLPISASVLEMFFTDIQSLLFSNITSIGSLSVEQDLNMLLSGIIDSKLLPLVPSFAAIFAKHIMSLKMNSLYHLSSPVSVSPQQASDPINLLLGYNTIYINVLGCYDTNIISLLTSKPSMDVLLATSNAQIHASNTTDFGHVFLWANLMPKAISKSNPNQANSLKKPSTPLIFPSTQYPSAGFNGYKPLDPHRYSYLAKPQDLSSVPELNASPFLRAPNPFGQQSLYSICKSNVINICPIIDHQKFSNPFIDSVSKNIITFPIPAIYSTPSNHSGAGNPLNHNLIKYSSVSSSVLKVCFNCWQMSLHHPPLSNTKGAAVTNTKSSPQQTLLNNQSTFGNPGSAGSNDALGDVNVNIPTVPYASAMPMPMPMSITKGYSEMVSLNSTTGHINGLGGINAMGTNPALTPGLNPLATSDDSSKEFSLQPPTSNIIFDLSLDMTNTADRQNSCSSSNDSVTNKSYYCQWIRRYDKHCVCGGDWIYI